MMNWSTSFSLCCARRLAWFWENGNSIPSRMICVNAYTGSPSNKESSINSGYWFKRCLYGLAPPYLSSMLTPVSSNQYSCRLRSAARGDLTVPCTRSVRMGPRSLAVSGPELWNSLAQELKNKTELFKRAYPVVYNSYILVLIVPLFTQCWYYYVFHVLFCARELYRLSRNGVSIRERLTKWLLNCIELNWIMYKNSTIAYK